MHSINTSWNLKWGLRSLELVDDMSALPQSWKEKAGILAARPGLSWTNVLTSKLLREKQAVDLHLGYNSNTTRGLIEKDVCHLPAPQAISTSDYRVNESRALHRPVFVPSFTQTPTLTRPFLGLFLPLSQHLTLDVHAHQTRRPRNQDSHKAV